MFAAGQDTRDAICTWNQGSAGWPLIVSSVLKKSESSEANSYGMLRYPIGLQRVVLIELYQVDDRIDVKVFTILLIIDL